MKKIYFSICALMFCAATMVHGQNSNTSVTYAFGFPMGDLGEFIESVSYRGVTIDFRSMAKENLGIGVSLGWNVFYEEKEYDTYTAGNASLSGKQFRYSNHVPMLVSADYYFKPLEKINPFIGLGTGVVYTRRNTDMNLYTIEQEAWNFTLQPEVGIQIQNDFSSGFTIMAKYYNGFAAGDLPEGQSYLTLNIGMVFR